MATKPSTQTHLHPRTWLQSPQLRLTSTPAHGYKALNSDSPPPPHMAIEKPSTQTHLHPRTKIQGTSSPCTDQGVIEPGAQQSVQGHTQRSRTVLPFPLNSRRMKAVYLRRVADKLGLPSNATANDLRQIVEGKLREMGHEPGNLQVAVEESPTTETLQLLNAYGPIIEVRHDKPLRGRNRPQISIPLEPIVS